MERKKLKPLVSSHGTRKWAEKQKTCKQLLIIAGQTPQKTVVSAPRQRRTRPPPLPGSKEVLEMSEKPRDVAGDRVEILGFHPLCSFPPMSEMPGGRTRGSLPFRRGRLGSSAGYPSISVVFMEVRGKAEPSHSSPGCPPAPPAG